MNISCIKPTTLVLLSFHSIHYSSLSSPFILFCFRSILQFSMLHAHAHALVVFFLSFYFFYNANQHKQIQHIVWPTDGDVICEHKGKKWSAGKLENRMGPHRVFSFSSSSAVLAVAIALEKQIANQKKGTNKTKTKKTGSNRSKSFPPIRSCNLLCFVLCNPSYVMLLCVRF